MKKRTTANRASGTLLPSKLRVMADYESSGIWVIEAIGPFRHGMISHESLKLPVDIANRFDEWITLYWKRLRDPDFDSDEFNDFGRAIAKELKQFVGDDVYVEFVPELPDGDLGEPEIIK